MLLNMGKPIVAGGLPSTPKIASGLSLLYEEALEPNTGVWFHKVLPLVCTMDAKMQIRIKNYECGKVLALFDLFAHGEQEIDPKILQRKLTVSNAMFVDKYAVVWGSGSTEVASSMISRLQHTNVPDYLLLIDKQLVIRWDYIGQSWNFSEVTSDSKNTICRSVLYDETRIVLGFEDGTIRLLNFMDFSTGIVLKEGGHKSSISFLSVFSRDLISKPFVISTEKNHPTTLCWNVESQSVAFKFLDTGKPKTVVKW